jgi:hypothetical protein
MALTYDVEDVGEVRCIQVGVDACRRMWMHQGGCGCIIEVRCIQVDVDAPLPLKLKSNSNEQSTKHSFALVSSLLYEVCVKRACQRQSMAVDKS